MKEKSKIIPWENTITNIQSNILEGLAKYKFLTLSQILRLEVGTTQYKYLHKQVASLRDRKKPLVKCNSYVILQSKKESQQRAGRVEDVYFLSNAGKKALLNELGFPSDRPIKIPIGNNKAYKDYLHRRWTVDFQIALNLWAKRNGIDLQFFDTYFDKVGNNRVAKNLKAKTKIDLEEGDYFIPDGIFKLLYKKQEFFFLFEMYNGKDTLRTMNQLHKHAIGLTRKFTHQKYGLDKSKAYTTVFIFRHKSLQQSFIKRVVGEKEVFAPIQNYFICKCLKDLEEDNFFQNWRTIFGRQKNLF